MICRTDNNYEKEIDQEALNAPPLCKLRITSAELEDVITVQISQHSSTSDFLSWLSNFFAAPKSSIELLYNGRNVTDDPLVFLERKNRVSARVRGGGGENAEAAASAGADSEVRFE